MSQQNTNAKQSEIINFMKQTDDIHCNQYKNQLQGNMNSQNYENENENSFQQQNSYLNSDYPQIPQLKAQFEDMQPTVEANREIQFDQNSAPLGILNYGTDTFYDEQIQAHNYYTQRDHLQQQITKQEEKYTKTIEEVYDTKNIPKTIGNYFRKYLLSIGLKLDDKENEQLAIFINKKKKGSQSAYGIEDMKMIFKDKKGNEVFSHFIENVFLLNLLQSNRIESISRFILFIEQYASGVKNPNKFISSRHHSQIDKKVKLNNGNQ